VCVCEGDRVFVQCACDWVQGKVLFGPVKIEPDGKTTCQPSFNKEGLAFSTQRLPRTTSGTILWKSNPHSLNHSQTETWIPTENA
jgi:hypothetical protein